MAEETEKKVQRWHIDKTVPVAWIFALVVQAAVIIYGYAMLTFQVADHDRRILKIESTVEASSKVENATENRITRIEEKLINQTQILTEIKDLLKQGAAQ